MGTVTELILSLIEELAKDFRKPLTINKLASQTGKAYANVHAAVQKLLKEEVLVKETVGHSHLCRLNLQNEKTALYISLMQAEKKSRLKKIDKILVKAITKDVILIWQREKDLLIVTNGEAPATDDLWMSLDDFMRDKDVWATACRHTLLYGHAKYASLLYSEGIR